MKTIWFGARKQSPYRSYGPRDREGHTLSLPVWPDIDSVADANGEPTIGKEYPGEVKRVSDLRALCLAPDTDFDLVRVFVDDDNVGFLLGPGQLVRFKDKAGRSTILVRAELQYPSTRLTSARQRTYATRRPLFPEDQAWEIALNEPAHQLRNVGNDDVQIYKWDGDEWVADHITSPGGLLGGIDNVFTVPESADYSPDGKVSFADYIQLGIILDENGDEYTEEIDGSTETVDSNGNPGGGTFVSGFLAGMDDHWQARCGLMVFEGEDPSCDFRPRLNAERVILLPEVDVPAEAEAGRPDTPIVTLPSYNVEHVQVTVLTTPAAANPLDVALGSPLAVERINEVAEVLNYQDEPIQAGAGGGGAATAWLPNINDLVQLVAGGNGGVSAIAAGSKIILRRRNIG